MAQSAGNLLDRVRQAADQAMELIFIFNQKGEIEYSNQKSQEELGYGEALNGKNLTEIFLQEFGPQERMVFDLERLLPVRETMMYRKNGTCFPVQISVVPGQRGLLYALNIAKWSETERKLLRVKEEAESSLKVRNEFVANVTHELRTPVNGIRGHLENLLKTEEDESRKRALLIMERCCGNMSAIIDSILDFSKLEAGKFELEEKKFHLCRMIEDVIETNITSIDAKGLRVMVNVEEDVPEYLIGDELRLSQILNNLISNAVKFTEAGYINVEVSKTLEFDDEIELFFVVSDTGIGISQTEKDRLFRSFSQVDASITRKYGGTGLGLAITKELVELMHGEIRLDSEKGKGSSFSFTVRLHVIREKTEERERQAFRFLSGRLEGTGQEPLERGNVSTEELSDSRKLQDAMEKLVLCLELEAWDKAEGFAHHVKKLLEPAPQEIRRAAFRLEMDVRREAYNRSIEQYEKLEQMLKDTMGGK